MRKGCLALSFAVQGLLLSHLPAAAQAPKVVLGLFQGSWVDQKIEALCWAIAPPSVTTVAKFCYVRVVGKDGRPGNWQRSDTVDFVLLHVAETAGSPKIVEWAEERNVDIGEDAISAVLSEKQGLVAEDVRKKLEAAVKPTPDFRKKSLTPNFSELKPFLASAGDFLASWSLPSSNEEVPTPPVPLAPGPTEEVSLGQVPMFIAVAIEEIRFLRTYALLLAASVSLLLLYAAVIFRLNRTWPSMPALVHWFKARQPEPLPSGIPTVRPGNGKTADTGARAVAVAETGPDSDAKLREVLKREGVNLGTSDLAADLLERVCTRLTQITGLNPESGCIDNSLEGIEKHIANMKPAGQAAPSNLKEAGEKFMALTSLLDSCKAQLDKILVAEVEPVETWAEPEFPIYLELKCDAITGRLNRLQTVAARFEPLGYSEDQVERAAEQAVSLAQRIWEELSIERRDFNGAQSAVDTLLRECKTLGESEPGVKRNPAESVVFARERLAEQKERIGTLDQDKIKLDRDLKDLEEVFKDFRGEGETPLLAAQRIAKEPTTALGLLKGIPGMSSAKLVDGLTNLVQWLDSADGQVRKFVPVAPDRIHDAVGAFATKYEEVSKELEARTKLTQEFRSYLYLSQDGLEGMEPVRRAIGLLRGETEGAHRALRLGLGSALAAWGEGVERLRNTGRSDVHDALRLQGVETELRDLLGRIEKKPGKALGIDLENGFERDWLHQLFRAEVLLDTYFAELEPCAVFREAVKVASGTLRVALYHFDCRVLRVDLLKPNPVLGVAEDLIRRENDAPRELRNVKEVRDRVAPYLESNGKDIFVDIRSFVYLKGNKENWHFEVVGITPADWR